MQCIIYDLPLSVKGNMVYLRASFFERVLWHEVVLAHMVSKSFRYPDSSSSQSLFDSFHLLQLHLQEYAHLRLKLLDVITPNGSNISVVLRCTSLPALDS